MRKPSFAALMSVFFLIPTPALAGTVSVTGSEVRYAAAAGERNSLSFTASTLPAGPSVHLFTVTDLGAPVTAGDGCVSTAANEARCVVSGTPRMRADLGDADDQLARFTQAFSVVADGGAGDDVLEGGTFHDELTGGTGNDFLGGGYGNDTLRGGEGDDVLDGADAVDTLLGGPGDDHLEGGRADDRLDGGPGGDALRGGEGFDTIDYSARTVGLTLTADGAADDGEPGEGDDVGDDIERIFGGSGDDLIAGGADFGELRGNAGADEISGGRSNQRLYGGPGDDLLRGGRASSAELRGEEGDDELRADAAQTVHYGGAGDDVAIGGPNRDAFGFLGDPGADVYVGGDDIDTLYYSSRSAGVSITPDGVANDGEAGEGDDVSGDIETIYGTQFDDRIEGGPVHNTIYGLQGADVLLGGDGNDTVAADAPGGYARDLAPHTLEGGPGNDILLGAAGDDVLDGGDGNDKLNGIKGDDTLDGGAGNDELTSRYQQLPPFTAFDEQGTDSVTCGDDLDVAWPGPADLLASDCEDVRTGGDAGVSGS